MENKINIAELLEDCPNGMELYSPIFGKLKFNEVNAINNRILVVQQNDCIAEFESDGRLINCKNGECLLFPSKGKTTWEGFVPPCKFKDGDILFVKSAYDWLLIYKESENDVDLYKYVATSHNYSYSFITYECIPICRKKEVSEIRLATEEEKKKLFDAIKANGYKWNEETKTLERLIEPKFKVGDKIKSIISSSYYTVVDIKNDQYFIKSDTEKYPYQVSFSNEINYKLVPDKFDIATLIPFESRVLMRSSNAREWVGTMYSHYNNNKFYGCGMCCDQCIPYEGNEDLLGTTDDCDEYFKIWE